MPKKLGECTCLEVECAECPFRKDERYNACMAIRRKERLIDGFEKAKAYLHPHEVAKVKYALEHKEYTPKVKHNRTKIVRKGRIVYE